MAYNKLVRDNIPGIIMEQGGSPVVETLEGEGFFNALKEKLKEEVAEYIENPGIEEIADILEVAYALAELHGADKVEEFRLNKKHVNGGFERRFFLIGIERGGYERG